MIFSNRYNVEFSKCRKLLLLQILNLSQLKCINDIRDNLNIILQEKNRITIVMRFRLEVINFCKVEGEQYLTSC